MDSFLRRPLSLCQDGSGSECVVWAGDGTLTGSLRPKLRNVAQEEATEPGKVIFSADHVSTLMLHIDWLWEELFRMEFSWDPATFP